MGYDGDEESKRPPAPVSDVCAKVTQLLEDASAGSLAAARDLLPLVYRSLHDLAVQQMNLQRRGHTLQATALVHEAYVRMVGPQDVAWKNRSHFYAAAAEAMRCVLIDHARRVGAKKRCGGGRRLDIASVADLAQDETITEALEIDEAIESLRREDPRAASIVQLRFYTGLSVDDTASALNIAPSTVDREWRYARAWLLRYLQRAAQMES